jgi:flagellar hook-basal body complex protein FliE
VKINGISNITSIDKLTKQATSIGTNKNATFENLLRSATMAIKETNQLSNAAKNAEISYAMGLTNSTHDLQIAQEKANIALQYTLAVRGAILDSYNQIMNIQF